MAYDNPGGLIAASAVLLVLALAAVGLRFYARQRQQIGFGVDDYLIVIALVIGIGLCVLEIYACAARLLGTPLGSPYWSGSAGERVNRETAVQLSFLNMGVVCIGFVKVSVICLFRRIFTTSVTFRRVTLVWMCICILWAVAFFIGTLLQCGSDFWALFSTPANNAKYCSHAIQIGWAMSILDVLTDAITLFLPIPMIAGLRMPVRRKIALSIIFLLGGLALGGSIGKCVIYFKATLDYNAQDGDLFLLVTAVSVWNLVECLVGIIAACLPTLRPVIVMLFTSDSVQYLISLLPLSVRSSISKVSTEQYGAQSRRDWRAKPNGEQEPDPHNRQEATNASEDFSFEELMAASKRGSSNV